MIGRRSGSRRWTPASLRLNDLDGNELLTRSFRPESHSDLLPASADAARTEALGRVSESAARNPVSRQVSRCDNKHREPPGRRGASPNATERPSAKLRLNLVAVSPDGSRLAVLWSDPQKWVFTVYDPDSGRQTADLRPGHRIHLGPCFQSGRHAHRHRRRRWPTSLWDTSDRHDDHPMARPLNESAERRVPP